MRTILFVIFVAFAAACNNGGNTTTNPIDNSNIPTDSSTLSQDNIIGEPAMGTDTSRLKRDSSILNDTVK